MNNIKYNHSNEVHNLTSPGIIVPALIKVFSPNSVIDVGCGLGNFLHIFHQHGIYDLVGLDGEWVDPSKLYIDPDFFRTVNLEKEIKLNRKFDLVLCLEVVEHLSPESADTIVKSLTDLGDIIIFSAATINQGGQNHLNEQPPTYWINKFKKYNYTFHDVFRKYFWNNNQIDWWYKQNMYLVVNDSIEFNIDQIAQILKPDNYIQEYIHPDLLQFLTDQMKILNKNNQKLEQILNGERSFQYYVLLLLKSLKRKISSR